MEERLPRIGIMGGSFNPVHHGHLFAAQEAYDRFHLDRVIFVPAYRNPFKTAEEWEHEMASTFHRFAMVELATSTNPDFYVSRFELERKMPSYALETVKHFHAEFGAAAQVYFITGTDAVLRMPQWKGIEEFHHYCEVIAVSRPTHIPDYERFIAQVHALGLKVYFLTIPALEISSSDIRDRVRRGLPIRYLTPTAVVVYIEKHGIYLDRVV